MPESGPLIIHSTGAVFWTSPPSEVPAFPTVGSCKAGALEGNLITSTMLKHHSVEKFEQCSIKPRREEREGQWREVEREKGILENQSLTSGLFAHTAFKVQLGLSQSPSGGRAGPGWDGLWPQEGLSNI